MNEHSHWRDRNFSRQMQRRRVRSRGLGRVIVTLVVLYFVGLGIYFLATTPDEPVDDQGHTLVYEGPPGLLR